MSDISLSLIPSILLCVHEKGGLFSHTVADNRAHDIAIFSWINQDKQNDHSKPAATFGCVSWPQTSH